MSKAIFSHAGHPVCPETEQISVNSPDKNRSSLEIVHFGDNASHIPETNQAALILFARLSLMSKRFTSTPVFLMPI